jgi:hypothetical protein
MHANSRIRRATVPDQGRQFILVRLPRRPETCFYGATKARIQTPFYFDPPAKGGSRVLRQDFSVIAREELLAQVKGAYRRNAKEMRGMFFPLIPADRVGFTLESYDYVPLLDVRGACYARSIAQGDNYWPRKDVSFSQLVFCRIDKPLGRSIMWRFRRRDRFRRFFRNSACTAFIRMFVRQLSLCQYGPDLLHNDFQSECDNRNGCKQQAP